MSHTWTRQIHWMSQVTRTNEHVTHMRTSHTCMSHVAHTNESCYTHEWVMSRTFVGGIWYRLECDLIKCVQNMFRMCSLVRTLISTKGKVVGAEERRGRVGEEGGRDRNKQINWPTERGEGGIRKKEMEGGGREMGCVGMGRKRDGVCPSRKPKILHLSPPYLSSSPAQHTPGVNPEIQNECIVCCVEMRYVS